MSRNKKKKAVSPEERLEMPDIPRKQQKILRRAARKELRQTMDNEIGEQARKAVRKYNRLLWLTWALAVLFLGTTTLAVIKYYSTPCCWQ